ncbi:unnamed protein product [Anisakis simplex]|uniref:G_PROTEIN_RECEP_F1_2 domain-containing protein n=1 Tax=Anisakis simplex TaxID=6269 RepID=A0A0M3JVM4_ANISI|nr:unnamed protein product [Anisakis simplex]
MAHNNDALFGDSDDSDVPDLDLALGNRRNKRSRLFPREGQWCARATKDVNCMLLNRYAFVLLLTSLVIAVAFLGLISVHLLSQNKQLQKLLVLPEQLDALKRDIKRLKTDVELLRLSSAQSQHSGSSSSSNWNLNNNGTLFISDRLDTIESEVKAIADEFKYRIGEHSSGPSVMEDIRSLEAHISSVEERCVQGCESMRTVALNSGTSNASSSASKQTSRKHSLSADTAKRKRSKGISYRDTPIIFTRLSMSGLTVMVVYFTTLVYTGLLVAIEPWRDCHAPYWIWMSAGNVITVQLIVVSLITIIYRLKGSVFTDNRRRNYKCEFYSLLWAFETSSLADLAYHITLYMIANEDEGCNGVFKHDQILYTTVKVPYELISFFMPIWIILFVFRAHSKSFDEEDSNSSTLFTACSTRSLNNVIVVRNWHRRYRPLGSSQWSFVNPSEEVASRRQSLSSCRNPISSRAFTSSRAHQVQRASQNSKPPPVFRRTQSAPSLTPLLRRNSVSTSVIVSPLYSIPEETSQAQLSSSSSSDNLSTVANVDSDH